MPRYKNLRGNKKVQNNTLAINTEVSNTALMCFIHPQLSSPLAKALAVKSGVSQTTRDDKLFMDINFGIKFIPNATAICDFCQKMTLYLDFLYKSLTCLV